MKFLYFILFFPIICSAQQALSGTVKDSITLETLPFATILTNNNQGVTTDIDGNFYLNTKNNFNSITISYVGYKSKTITNINKKHILIALQPLQESIGDVVIAAKGINPAIQIIKNTIAHKNQNDVQKALNSFKLKAYTKLLVTANPDSISTQIDTIYKVTNGKKTFAKLDSTNYKFKKEISKYHLYISEKIAEHRFVKGKNKKEIILASRMAGFKQPLYEILAINMQDFSFYKEKYSILGTAYNNPIAKNGLQKYRFKILDTVQNGFGNSYMIHYKPKRKSQLQGMEGLLYIDTKTFAITKAVAELRASIFIKASQDFEYFPSEKIWFPKQTSVLMKKGKGKGKMSILGGMVVLDNTAKKDSLPKKPKAFIKKENPNNADNQIYFINKTTFYNIEINQPVHLKKAATSITFTDDANSKSELFWKNNRIDSITQRGKMAYTYLDSIVEKEGIEKKIVLGRKLLKGYFHTKYLDLDISKILALNNYEGLRLGVGGKTNESLSRNYYLEGYLAYGTKDKAYKYKVGAAVRLNKESNTWLGANHVNDLKEAAALDFLITKNGLSISNPRKLNLLHFYNHRTWNIFIKHDIKSNLESVLQLRTGVYTPTFTYTHANVNPLTNSYKLSMATADFYYSPFSTFMNAPTGKITVKNRFPKFHLQLRHSFKNVLESDFNFTQINLKTLYTIKRLQKATTSFLLQGGMVIGDAPLTHLYNATPNYTYKSPWIWRTTFAGKNSFETMGYNEFISDKYAMLQVKHAFKSFNFGKKFKPQLTLVSRLAFGNIQNPGDHLGITFQKMNRGYYESGFEINKLFKGFGISSFYRLGSYTNPIWSDNLALKLTYHLSLGF